MQQLGVKAKPAAAAAAARGAAPSGAGGAAEGSGKGGGSAAAAAAGAALQSAKKATSATAAQKAQGKVLVTETRRFAGQDIQVTHGVPGAVRSQCERCTAFLCGAVTTF